MSKLNIVLEGGGRLNVEGAISFSEDGGDNPSMITYNISSLPYLARRQFQEKKEFFKDHIEYCSHSRMEFTLYNGICYKFFRMRDIKGLKIHPDSLVQTNGLNGRELMELHSRIRS